MSKGWFTAKSKSGNVAEIAVFGEIGSSGVTADAFASSLRALGRPREIRLSIDSAGGDVTTGFAIFNTLSRHPAKIVVTVEGLAASMASVVAMAGDEVVMPANAMMMIHNPWGSVIGESDQIASFADALATMQESIAQTYKGRTGLPLSDIRGMMDRETWLSADEAVAKGFADRIEKPVKAMHAKAYNLSRFGRVPPTLAQRQAAGRDMGRLDVAAIYRRRWKGRSAA